MTSSGVPIHCKICGVNSIPTTVRNTPAAMPKAILVWMAARIFSTSREPKNRETTTPAPIEIPPKNPTSKKMSVPVPVTAASALLPSRLPTMRASAVLYSCWKIWLSRTGSAKPAISFHGLPTVMSRIVLFTVHPSFPGMFRA